MNVPLRFRCRGRGEINDAAATVVHPDNLVWIVVADRSKTEAGIRELNTGEVRVIDTDGKRIK